MRKGSFLFLLMSLMLVARFAAADNSCSDWEARWNARYIRDFGVSWNTDTFVCSSEGSIAEAIYHLEKDTYNANSSGYTPNFYKAIADPITHLSWDQNCKYLGYTRRSTGTITLCPPFLKETAESRASTLVHEGRHLESDDPAHVTCVGGPYNGNTGACDEYFHDGARKGSGYNADIFYMGWALRAGNNLNGLSEAILRGEIRALLPDRFNHITSEEIKKWRD